jgi:hypothetical protein
MAGSSSASSHSSPSRARTARSDPTSEANALAAARREIPAPGEPVSGRRPEDVEVASSEFAARGGRVDLGSVERPDRRRTRAFPTDGDRARRRGSLGRLA